MAFLLPLIGQETVAGIYDYQVGFSFFNSHPVNGPAFLTNIKVYQCPSDIWGKYVDYGANVGSRSNYVGCFSPDFGWVDNDAPVNINEPGPVANPTTKKSLFNFNMARRIEDVTDGTSNTVIASEVRTGPDGTCDLRGVWWHDFGAMYTHHLPPNSPLPDNIWTVLTVPPLTNCTQTKAPCVGDTACWSLANFAARSYHQGGVNTLFADGHTAFVANTIDLTVWQNLASINGDEVIPANY